MQSQEIIHIAGGPAYSKFRKEKLLGKLQKLMAKSKIFILNTFILFGAKKITDSEKVILEKFCIMVPRLIH